MKNIKEKRYRRLWNKLIKRKMLILQGLFPSLQAFLSGFLKHLLNQTAPFIKSRSLLSDSLPLGQHIRNPMPAKSCISDWCISLRGLLKNEELTSDSAFFSFIHLCMQSLMPPILKLLIHYVLHKLHNLLILTSLPEPTAVLNLKKLSVTNNVFLFSKVLN